MVNWYLVRHARAEMAGPELEDAERPLTEEGRARFAKVVRRLDRFGVKLDRLYYSPLLRAVQTADMMTLLLEGESHVTPYLAQQPGDELLQMIEGQHVALVGHQPWIGALTSLMTAGDFSLLDKLRVKKGQVIWLEGEPVPGGMELRASVPPRWFR